MPASPAARVSAGTPDGGQFTETQRREPDVRLDVAPAPATLPRTSDLTPVELEASGRLPAGWGLADARTGKVVFGNDRRRGRHASAQEAQDWATTTYPLIRKVAQRSARVVLNPPHGRRCPECGGDLVQDIADTTASTVVTACDSCNASQRTVTARPARRTR